LSQVLVGDVRGRGSFSGARVLRAGSLLIVR